MIANKNRYGRLTVDKYFDVRYADEIVFEYLGENAYKAISNYIHEDYQEDFRKAFDNADTHQWTGVFIKMQRHDGVYRDGYVEIKKKDHAINDIQLWDLCVYDMEILTESYHDQLLYSNTYKTLVELSGIDYFRYEHEKGTVSICKIVNAREVVIFSTPLQGWADIAVSQGHVAEKDRSLFKEFCNNISTGKREFSIEVDARLSLESENTFPCCVNCVTIFDDKDLPWHTIGRIVRRNEAHTSSIAPLSLDPLTGLFSKKSITDKAKTMLNEASGNIALFILDVDNFKGANDNYGHMFGDTVLSKIANVIADTVGNNGIAGRVGGDEFMGVITGFEDHADLKGKMRSLRSKIEYLFADLPNVKITCSIGACQKQESFKDYESIFACADRCLYMAKDKGKNRYVIYIPKLHGELSLNNGRIKGLKDIKHTVNECSVINEAVSILYKEGYAGIEKVMNKFITELIFDRVTVYYGENFKRLLWKENISSEYDYAYFGTNPDYINQFNEDNMLSMDTIYRFEEMEKAIYIAFTKQHTESFIQMLIGSKDNVKGFISFECCSGEKKFSKNMLNYVSIVAHLMSTIIEEEFH